MTGAFVTSSASVVVDHVAALHAHERGNLPVGCGPPDISGGGGKDEVRWMPSHGFVHTVDQSHGAPDGEGARHITRHPDGEEQGAESALAHPGHVDAPAVVTPADVEGLVEEESLCCVVVRVNDDRATVDLAGPARHGAAGWGLCGNGNRRDDGGD